MTSTNSKQKSLWPHGIISVFIILALFDAYIVMRALQTGTGTVTNNPYEEGLRFEEKIESRRASFSAKFKMSVQNNSGRLIIDIIGLESESPSILKLKLIKPDNPAMDRSLELKSNSNQFISDELNLKSGLWMLEAKLKSEGLSESEYYFESKELL